MSENEGVIAWAKGMTAKLKANQSALGVKHGSNSGLLRVHAGYGPRNGVINKIGFSMPMHGIFLSKGVGKGRWAGSGKEQPKDWFNSSIKEGLDELADVAAERQLRIASNLFID